MTITEILVILGCAAMFVVLGLLTRDSASSLLLRAEPSAPADDGETDAGRCGACAHPCETSEHNDA